MQAKAGIFKKTEKSKLQEYLEELQGSCFICDRVNETLERYYTTIFYLFQNNEEFLAMLKNCQGFCNEHYKQLLDRSWKHLS